MEKRIFKSQSDCSRRSGLEALTSGEFESSSSRVKKLPNLPVSHKRSESSSVSGTNVKSLSCSKEKEPVGTKSRQTNTPSSRESVVEVLSPLRAEKHSTSIDEETKDLIGEYRRRLYERSADAPPLTQVQRLEENIPLQDSGQSKRSTTLCHHRSHGKKPVKHSQTPHRPLYGLQYNPDQVTDKGYSNGKILEKLMSDIVKRIHSYESNYYKGIWCDKNNILRSRTKIDIKLQQRPAVPYVFFFFFFF